MIKVLNNKMYVNKYKLKVSNTDIQVGSKDSLINRYFKSHFGRVSFNTG